MYPRTAIGPNELFNGCIILFYYYFQYLARTQLGCVTGNTGFEMIEANTGKRVVVPLLSRHDVNPVGLVWSCLFNTQAGSFLFVL